MNFVRAYLRASTDEQNAQRAKQSLLDFAAGQNISICTFYTENQSGAKLSRPELFRLLNDSQQGDILLIEDIDRLSRLNNSDWELLKSKLTAKQIRIVALNVPTTWGQGRMASGDDFDSRMLAAINSMLIDMLAAVARRDYEQRRQRQAQGIAKAKQQGKYKGRPKNLVLYHHILKLLDAGSTWADIKEILGCSSTTIARAKVWRAGTATAKSKNQNKSNT